MKHGLSVFAFAIFVGYSGYAEEALKAYGDYIRVLDGTWYLAVKRKMSDDLAFDCDRMVWDRMEVHDVEITRQIFGYQGR